MPGLRVEKRDAGEVSFDNLALEDGFCPSQIDGTSVLSNALHITRNEAACTQVCLPVALGGSMLAASGVRMGTCFELGFTEFQRHDERADGIHYLMWER
ncbi:hypothetical protein KFE25_002725 [Diacronema lutheri]|uniref:Uncharacterized protein n=1 Tax=Diacronema lutheri TaxID=2081491 RepID=A0A8J5XIZ7_DIALT|nr:hypothetical protein KFE25_002725 [Diacronema lutheri]